MTLVRSAFAAACICGAVLYTAAAGDLRTMLAAGVSKKNIVANAFTRSGHLYGAGTAANDTIRIIALRVDFPADTSPLTTGTGKFSVVDEKDEIAAYRSDTIYKYDRLPHDSAYFARQLDFASGYYRTISRGHLRCEYAIYPAGPTGAYTVPHTMNYYSPGGKKKKESWNEYYERQTRGLVNFVHDAVQSSKDDASWFSTLKRDPATGIVRDTITGRKVIFLIIHAGASVSTDGGEEGEFGKDTPSDMIDAFFSQDFFKTFFAFFKDSTFADTTGIIVPRSHDSLLIDEVMLVSETSNQDNLNWGIHGILVNQVARQIGIPDLFSTTSGLSGVGAFCIMDAGFFSAYGFIPPWPSAWVRLYMGWDNPLVAQYGESGTYRIKAPPVDTTGDSTILLVPINDHEYYLIENRQRDLSGKGHIFAYDTTENDDTVYIAPYPFNVKLDSLVVATSGDAASNVITKVNNYDAGLPASGVLVWHVDEQIIRERIRYNMVNADSMYRGVSLVEADGVSDLGITFQNALSQAAFDYGGAEDVFPHRNIVIGRHDSATVDSMGPFTRPATKSNDGGHSFLTIGIKPAHAGAAMEKTAVRDYYVLNYADTAFDISVQFGTAVPEKPNAAARGVKPQFVPGWPRRMVLERCFEPASADLFHGDSARELCVLSESGRLYVWKSFGQVRAFGRAFMTMPALTIMRTDSAVPAADTIRWLAGLPAPAAMPAVIDNRIYVPCAGSRIAVLDSLAAADPDTAAWRMIALPCPASTWISLLSGGAWAAGCSTGAVVWGDTTAGADTVRGKISLASISPVCAIAALAGETGRCAVVQSDGLLSMVDLGTGRWTDTTRLRKGIGPYALVTGDLNRDNANELVVSDSRQGLWCFAHNLRPAFGWPDDRTPIDWAAAYTYLEKPTNDRAVLPANPSAPALADLNRDGFLDILISGTNGLYALNYKGVPVTGWPSYLDNRYWYYRGNVLRTPIIGADASGTPFIAYASPTGENATFSFFHIDSTNAARTKVYYTQTSGARDSIPGLRAGLVDSLLKFGDSLISNYIMPGGFVDLLNAGGMRPAFIDTLANVGVDRQSYWPLTMGTGAGVAPMVADLDADGGADMVAVSAGGLVYRWKLDGTASVSAFPWPQAGYDGARSFAYSGTSTAAPATRQEAISFFSYPNPTHGSRSVTFRFRFSGPTRNARLDIYTMTGLLAYSWTGDADKYATNWQDWSELPPVSLDPFGPGVYRCRLEATVDGRKQAKFWKMAVVK